MTTLPMTPFRWSLSFLAAWLLLPVAPALLVMLLGFVLPGAIPWAIVEASFPVASVAAFVVCAFLLWRSVSRFHVGTGQREPTYDAG